MSKQEESINRAGAISRRFITCTQSTGRVGKSTVAEGLITWMRYAGIDFAAVDADSEHQTLSRRYPEDSAIFDATKTFDGFARMLNELPPFPLIVVDFPAQATDFLLSAARHFKLVEFFEQSGIRPTLLVFAADDPTAKESAAKTVRFFGDDVDYLLVERLAGTAIDADHTNTRNNCPYHERLGGLGAQTQALPALGGSVPTERIARA
jgi:hypothetical protein